MGADTVAYHADEPTVYRQFAYVLGPGAVMGPGSAGWDVTVHLPRKLAGGMFARVDGRR